MTPTTPAASTTPALGLDAPIPPTMPYVLLRSWASVGDLGLMGRRSLERMAASASATARGAETLRAQAMTCSQQSLRHDVDAAQAMFAAKSMQELVDLQTAYAKTRLEMSLAQANLLAETATSTLSACLAPLVGQEPAGAEHGDGAA